MVIFYIIAHWIELKDLRATSQTLLLDEPVNRSHKTYIVSFSLRGMPKTKVPTDVYIRLRGSVEDSPLIVYRDFDAVLIEDRKLNLVVSLKDDIGPVVQESTASPQ